MGGMFKLTDKVAVVTGAGRGIGQAIARTYAEAGARVAVVSRTEANAARAAEEINALIPGAAKPYAVDVASGVESSPGRKDPVKMRDFVQAVLGAV